MGLFKKILSTIKAKKSVAKQIKEKKLASNVINQKKFDLGLKKSSGSFKQALEQLAAKYHTVNEELLEAIEAALLMFDIGTSATSKIMQAITDEIKFQKVSDPKLIEQIVYDKLLVYYIQDSLVDTSLNLQANQTNVILVTGVNGVGKTTSIAKLAKMLKNLKYKVMIVAADTFRAGAVSQLAIWANRVGVSIYQPQKANQDPASVIYQALTIAKKDKYDVIICDTSGRLQNKINLMNELKKIDQVIKKFEPSQPCESLLVLDATTGQNGISQARAFNEVTKLSGIILTKMDSTSKGGIVLAIKDAFSLPVKLIGFGEQVDDLQAFDIENFIMALATNLAIK